MIHRRAFAAGLAVLAAPCGRSGGFGRLAAGETGEVASVRSGEVLTLADGLEVRLVGIEGPNGAEPLADEARAFLVGHALGKRAELRYGGLKRDRYDRALAQVRAGGEWLQGEILSAGLARVRTYSDNRALAAEMLELEARARVAGKGLWALADYGVLLPGECAGKGGFQIVEGKVVAASEGERSLRLSLLGGVDLEFPRFVLDAFSGAGKHPSNLMGAMVRARGVMRSKVLRVDHPEQIEVLRVA